METYISRFNFELLEKYKPILVYMKNEENSHAIFAENFSEIKQQLNFTLKVFMKKWNLNVTYVAMNSAKDLVSVYIKGRYIKSTPQWWKILQMWKILQWMWILCHQNQQQTWKTKKSLSRLKKLLSIRIQHDLINF